MQFMGNRDRKTFWLAMAASELAKQLGPTMPSTPEEQVQEAIDELIAAYVEAFGEQPDNVTGMVIRSSVQRVIDGEPYEWKQEGQWRRLVWL